MSTERATHKQASPTTAGKAHQANQMQPAEAPEYLLSSGTIQRSLADPGQLSPKDVLSLQRTVGNQAVLRLLESRRGAPPVAGQGSSLVIQPKLTVGPVSDPYEREADQVAAQVMRQVSKPEPTAESGSKASAGNKDMSLGRGFTKLAAMEDGPWPAPVSHGGVQRVQRLIDRRGLVAQAGEAHGDVKVFGRTVKKMSTAYKNVLSALDRYHGFLSSLPTVETGTSRFNAGAILRINSKLDELRDALQNYVDEHGDDAVRTPHIRDIIQNGIPRERILLTEIGQHSQNYLFLSFKTAIERVERLQDVTARAVTFLATQSNRQKTEVDTEETRTAKTENRAPLPNMATMTGDALKARALSEYDTAMTAISAGGGTVDAFSFRDNTRTTKAGSAAGQEMSRGYFQNVIVPALAPAIHVQDQDVEIDLGKIEGATEEEKTRKHTTNLGKLRSIYQNFMRTFVPEQAERVPLEFARFIAQVFQTASTHMDPENAYLFASSQIFLRAINPQLGALASSTQGQGGQRALIYVSKLLQDDANAVRHGASKEAYMRDLADLSYTDQIRDFVAAVVARGQG